MLDDSEWHFISGIFQLLSVLFILPGIVYTFLYFLFLVVFFTQYVVVCTYPGSVISYFLLVLHRKYFLSFALFFILSFISFRFSLFQCTRYTIHA